MWRIQPVDAVSFMPVMAPLDASAVSWERVLNGAGRASFTVQTKAKNVEWEPSWWRDLDTEWKTILVLEWVADDGVRTPMYAGWVANRSAWDPRAGVATWDTFDARVWLSSRFVYPAKYRGESWFQARWSLLNYSSADAAATMIRYAIGEGMVRNIGTGEVRASWDRASDPRYSMPLVFSVDKGNAGLDDFRYWGRERHVEDMVSEVQSRADGPDIDFVPEWAEDGSLRLHVQISSPELVRNTVRLSSDLAPGAKSDLLDLSIVKDGMMSATSMTGFGAGHGSDMETVTVYESDVPGARTDVPQRERKHEAKQTEDAGQLRAETRGALLRHRSAAKAWAFNVICGDTVQVTDFMPGTRVVVDYPGDLLEPAALKTFVVTGVAGDLSQTLRLTVQEVG